jgi:hypothetical protein
MLEHYSAGAKRCHLLYITEHKGEIFLSMIGNELLMTPPSPIFHVIKWKILNREPSLLFNTSFPISFPVDVMGWK